MEFIAQYGAVVATGVNLIVIWAVWSIRRAVDEQLGAVKDGMGRMHGRVTRLESALDAVPSGSEIGGLKEQIASLHGDMRMIGAHIDGLRDVTKTLSISLDRINDYLLKREK